MLSTAREFLRHHAEYIESVTFFGLGLLSTALRCFSSNANFITISTAQPIDWEYMTLGVTNATGQTAGSLVNVTPSANGINQFSNFRNLYFQQPFLGLDFFGAQGFDIDRCQFISYVFAGVRVADAPSPDTGDSLIEGDTTFNGASGTGSGILYLNSGGLKVTSCKFLGGAYHLQAIFNGFPTNTGDLLFLGNSSEAASVANISITATGSTTFGNIQLCNNQIATSVGAKGVWFKNPGYIAINDTLIQGNIVEVASNGFGYFIDGGTRFTLGLSHFIGEGTTPRRFTPRRMRPASQRPPKPCSTSPPTGAETSPLGYHSRIIPKWQTRLPAYFPTRLWRRAPRSSPRMTVCCGHGTGPPPVPTPGPLSIFNNLTFMQQALDLVYGHHSTRSSSSTAQA